MHDETGPPKTSPTLLARVRDPANEAAWREFENRYAELLWRYCRRRGLPPVDAEDVRQLVWLNLARGLRKFEYDPGKGRFRAYLGRVVQNAIARHFSRKNPADRQLDSDILAMTPDDDGHMVEVWEQEWVDHHYRLAFETIEATFEQKSLAAFHLTMDGKSAAEVATELDLTTNAVHQINHRIRERMKELVTRQVAEEDEPGYSA